jgi:sister-chromatid-cohesion protein PDS5
VLKEISTSHPKVFSTHVKELCKALESEAPTADTTNPPGAVQDLKACAGFAKKFPKDLPLNTKDGRKLIQSLVNFALYGSPPKAAKHAITIIINSDNKKEMRVKEILSKSIKNFDYGCDHFLTKLAAISQLVLLAPQECEDDIDAIVDIAVNRVLLKPHPTSTEAEAEWMETPDDDLVARSYALKILVNRLRSLPQEESIAAEVSTPIYTMLNRLVKENGEASKKKNTPLGHKNFQRLLAAQLLLKLSSSSRRLDALLTPTDFNQLALVSHDQVEPIRKGFATKLMKYLGQGQNRLPTRFYTILFMYAYEPDSRLLEGVTTWIRSRRAAFEAHKDTTFETIFARLLSLLAHHPDFDIETMPETLKTMTKWILFYLKCVATPDNLSLIYHVAQRVKGVADGISSTTQASENLYILSDLAQALIRIWEEQNGWSMQAWPGKLKLPAGIFKPLESHDRAQEIADKVWVDEDLAEELEPLVRDYIRGKKRKARDGAEKSRKKVKSEKGVKVEKAKKERTVKTPKSRKRKNEDSDEEEGSGKVAAASREPRRKSDRRSNAKSYVELSSDEEEDAEAGAEEEDADEEDDEEEDAEAGAEEDQVMEKTNGNASPEPEEDVEMAEAEPEEEQELEREDSPLSEPEQQPEEEEEEEEEEPEPTPEPTPKQQRRSARDKGDKKTNGTKASPAEKRTASKPAKVPTPATKQTKPKVTTPKKATAVSSTKTNGKGKAQTTSSPAVSSSVRRSARSRG